MGMEMKLQFKLQQQLVMTPQLVQAIRLLQLSRLELVDEVRKELDGNPVLADDATDPKAREIGEKLSASAASNEERLESMERSDREKSDLGVRETEKRSEAVDWEKLLENRQQQQALPSHRGGFEDMPPIEQNLTKPSNLRDHLVWQLQMSDFVDNERNFAELVIGNLDDKGYLDLKGGEGQDGQKEADLTIEDLAREAGISRSVFAERFLSATGTTPAYCAPRKATGQSFTSCISSSTRSSRLQPRPFRPAARRRTRSSRAP